MKKSLYTIISVLLVLAIIASSALTALALEPEKKQADSPVVVAGIGDSILQGYSLYPVGYSECACNLPNLLPYSGKLENKYARNTYKYLIGYVDDAVTPEDIENNQKLTSAYEKAMLNAYPLQVAMALNLSEDQIAEIDTYQEFCDLDIYQSLSANSLRSVDIRAALDPDYYAELESEGFDAMWYSKEVYPLHEVTTREKMTEKLSKSDILIYSVCAGDWLYGPLINAIGSGEWSSSDITADVIADFIPGVAKGIADYTENTPIIIDEFRKMNPDLIYVFTGMYNLLSDNDLSHLTMSLSDDAVTLLTNTLTSAIGLLNQFMRDLATRYDDIIYVDTNGVDTLEKDADGNTVSGDGTHPSIAGHRYIARRILSVLPDQYVSRSRYDIKIDLYGSCAKEDQVTAVLVNQIVCTDFEKDGYTLTVHYQNAAASTVTVFTKGEKIGINTWQCRWNSSDGYRTYSLLRVSDAQKTALLPVTKLKDSINSISAKIKALFK